MVIADMLGIPADDWVRFKRWSDGILLLSDTISGTEEDSARAGEAFFKVRAEMEEYLNDYLRTRAGQSNNLLSRLAGTEIHVPGLDQRTGDLEAIITGVVEDTLGKIRERIGRALGADTAVDRRFWKERSETIRCPDGLVERFMHVDWSRHGHMRGLAGAVSRAVAEDADLDAILERLPVLDTAPAPDAADRADLVYRRLLGRPANGDGLLEHLRELGAEDALALQQHLKRPGAIRELARSLGLDERKVLSQAAGLGRRRRSVKGAGA